jgi:hypothetical protein
MRGVYIIKLSISVIMLVLPLFALEFGIGIVGDAGLGFSRWEMDIYDTNGTFLTDHLQSNEPVFNLGVITNVMFTKNIGIRASLQYAWYNYNYTYNYSTNSDALIWKWHYKNLIFPTDLVFSIPAGKHKIIMGTGLIVCKQLKGEMSGITGGINLPVEEIPEDYLETTIAPQFFMGIEFLKEHIILSPTISYSYGLDGVGKEFATEISSHYVIMNLAVLYKM